jgi:hypothetical protein
VEGLSNAVLNSIIVTIAGHLITSVPGDQDPDVIE